MKYSPSTRLPMSRPCMSVKATMTVSMSPFLTEAVSSSLVSTPSPCRLFFAAARPRDEALEQMTRPGHIRSELFGMALHGDDETVVRLHPFDCAVLAGGGLLDPVSQVLDGLVVEAVDPGLVLTRRTTQLTRWIDVDPVRQVAAP